MGVLFYYKKEGEAMERLPELIALIRSGDVHRFYTSPEWRRKRREVFDQDHFECQVCKNKYKRYTKATTVHHIKELRHFPSLCLSSYYTNESGMKERNLISVCKYCHETECHPERMGKYEKKKPLTEEKW